MSTIERVDSLNHQPSPTKEYYDEKAAHSVSPVGEHPVLDEYDDAEVHGISPGDPFPIDPDAPHEEYTLTVRAILIGCMLGAVVGASNIYLGLKTGFTFGPQLFGAIFGFGILKPLSKIMYGRFPGWIGTDNFGPKENVTVQTAATAAGGIGIIFVSAIPAMYRLNLLSYLPKDDFGRLAALTVSSAFFGVFFVIPLRKYYILKQKLVFPTPTATAFTIRALHAGQKGAEAAKKKTKALAISFLGALCFKTASGYAPGIIWDWHLGWTLYRIGWTSIISLDNYGWWIEFTPAFYGAGMLSGMNASWSFLGGMILAWGIIAPSLIHTGKAVGIPISDDFPLVSYFGLKFADLDDYIHAPSPRYWLLWPGVLIMLVYSFVDVILSTRGAIWNLSAEVTNQYRRWRSRNDPVIHAAEVEEDYDPAPLEDRVPNWAWISGLILSIIVSCALCATQFHMNVGEVILALILGFLFSFMGVQSSGYTDINPVSTCAKASQLIFGGVGKGQGLALENAQLLNLVGGTLAAGSAAQATDMTGDLKTGHLVGAKPKVQFVAQLCGVVVAVFLNIGLFNLFTKASPCILYPPPSGVCTYGAPSVSAWAAVSLAVTSPKLPIPPSSGYTAIGLAIAAALTVVAKHFWIPKKYWAYIPNWNAIGLAFVVFQTYYAIAMAFGATINWIWARRSPKTFDMYGFPLAAGLVAGEGLGGVLQALLAIAGVNGDGVKFGTWAGCPGNSYCG